MQEPNPTTNKFHIACAWLSFPVIMVAFFGAALFCIQQSYDPGIWVPVLAASNFFVLVALEQLLPRNPNHQLFRDPQAINDLIFNTLNGAIRPTLGAVAVVFVAWLSTLSLASESPSLWPQHWPFGLQVLIAILCAALVDYCVHRASHTFDRLWWFHSLHHIPTQMHVLKGGRIHFIDEFLHDFFTPLPFLLLGAPTEVILMSGMWGVFTGNLVHCNVDQRFPSWVHYILPTVQLHNLHHSNKREWQDSNYSGTTPIWDWLFGTLSHPEKCQLDKMGIEDDYVATNFFKQLWLPFVWQVNPPGDDTEEIQLSSRG